MRSRFRRDYGAPPAHLIGHVLAFAAFVWAFSQILGGGFWINYVAWFVGAAVLHDLVVLPIYSLLDRLTRWELRRALSPGARAAINYLRVPALISAVLFLVYSPQILGYSDRNYRNDTGHALHGELLRWLLITAGLFMASALVYFARAFWARLTADARRLASPRPDA